MPNYASSTTFGTVASETVDIPTQRIGIFRDEVRIDDVPLNYIRAISYLYEITPRPVSSYDEFGHSEYQVMQDDVYYTIPYQNLDWYARQLNEPQESVNEPQESDVLTEENTEGLFTSEALGRIRQRMHSDYAREYTVAWNDAQSTAASASISKEAIQNLADKVMDSLTFEKPKMKKRRMFSKRHPFKMRFEKIDSTANVKKETGRLLHYKKFLASDPEMGSSLAHNINREIQRIRYKRRNSMAHNKLIMSYRGVEEEVKTNKDGFVNFTSYKNAKKKLVSKLKKERYRRRVKNQVHKSIENVPYALVGGVHERPGSILDLFNRIGHNRVNSLRRPETDENHVGIEVEFYTEYHREDITNRLIDAKLTKNCRIMTDTSIRPKSGRNGYELCILAPEKELADIIYRACDVLNDIGAEVNESCGLHVHLDCRNRDKSLLYHNLYRFQSLLFSLVSPTRQESRYCQKQHTENFDEANNNHYAAISTASYRKHRTIEIRMHHGTAVAREIINWVNLLTKIANYGKKITVDVKEPTEISSVVDLDTDAYEYFNSRYRLFGS